MATHSLSFEVDALQVQPQQIQQPDGTVETRKVRLAQVTLRNAENAIVSHIIVQEPADADTYKFFAQIFGSATGKVVFEC